MMIYQYKYAYLCFSPLNDSLIPLEYYVSFNISVVQIWLFEGKLCIYIRNTNCS
jgi:hypothetical protein